MAPTDAHHNRVKSVERIRPRSTPDAARQARSLPRRPRTNPGRPSYAGLRRLKIPGSFIRPLPPVRVGACPSEAFRQLSPTSDKGTDTTASNRVGVVEGATIPFAFRLIPDSTGGTHDQYREVRRGACDGACNLGTSVSAPSSAHRERRVLPLDHPDREDLPGHHQAAKSTTPSQGYGCSPPVQGQLRRAACRSGGSSVSAAPSSGTRPGHCQYEALVRLMLVTLHQAVDLLHRLPHVQVGHCSGSR